LEPELRAFCTEAEPPVACTFGTGMMHAGRIFRFVLEACDRLGKRCVLLTRHRTQLPSPLPPHARLCQFVSFRELFPKCSAVIHHGGIGTVATACSTATPQLLVPFAYDQMDNASRVQRLGIGDGIPAPRVTVERVAGALERLTSQAVKERCGRVAARFAGANAIERAVDCILQNPQIRSSIGLCD
jgi:UDP:flavonoid glycosyltransferase YjiC (YdhE family)